MSYERKHFGWHHLLVFHGYIAYYFTTTSLQYLYSLHVITGFYYEHFNGKLHWFPERFKGLNIKHNYAGPIHNSN